MRDYYKCDAGRCSFICTEVEQIAGELCPNCQDTMSEFDPAILHKQFDADLLPTVQEVFEKDGKPDFPARREEFNIWTDQLCKNGVISDGVYNDIDHPASCEPKD